MSNLFDYLKSNTSILAATITGFIGIFGVIVAIINFISSNNNKRRDDFLKILTEKLTLIYSPLYFKYIINEDFRITDDSVLINDINKYSFLLSNKLLDLLTNIISIELKTKNDPSYDNELYAKLYQCKRSFINLLTDDYTSLMLCYNRIYANSEKRFIVNANKNLWTQLRKLSELLAVIFFSMLFILSYLNKHFSIYSIAINIENSITYILAITILIGSYFFIGTLVKKLNSFIDKLLHQYKPNDKVNIDSYYRCIYCDTKKYFFKDAYFISCPNLDKHDFLNFDKTRWIKHNHKSIKKIMQTLKTRLSLFK